VSQCLQGGHQTPCHPCMARVFSVPGRSPTRGGKRHLQGPAPPLCLIPTFFYINRSPEGKTIKTEGQEDKRTEGQGSNQKQQQKQQKPIWKKNQSKKKKNQKTTKKQRHKTHKIKKARKQEARAPSSKLLQPPTHRPLPSQNVTAWGLGPSQNVTAWLLQSVAVGCNRHSGVGRRGTYKLILANAKLGEKQTRPESRDQSPEARGHSPESRVQRPMSREQKTNY
jgi:hypothetical protein